MPPHLEHEASQVPVTALSQPWPDIIFAGQGSILKIYDRASTQLIHYERIFASQAIHGFAFRKSADDASITLLAWGGRSIFACEVIREESSKSEVGYKIYVKKKTVVKISDWIFDIAFQPEATSATARTWTAVLVNAHNEVFEVTGHSSSEGLSGASPSVTLQKLFSGPRCGLYSATLRWLSAEHVLIISGTAFGEIVVWSLTRSQEIVEARRHYVFTGHEGSIFGVAVSDELRLPDGVKKRLLASCSDDRTIRVWDVSDLDSGLVLAKDDIRDSERDASRTTGFLNYVSEEAAAASSQLCLAVGMGHLSRIWDVQFAREEAEQASTDYICSIVSVGEDATCQKWHLINSGARFSLEHIASNAFHEGKNIWSMSVTRDSERLCILSGGADGKIVEHHSLSKSSPSQASHLQISEWDIERTLQALETTSDGQDMNAIHTIPRKGKADSFRSFAAIGTSQLLITTNEGLILLATCSSTGEWSWKQIAEFEGLKGYSVASHLVAEPFEYVFFGDAKGNIYYYHSFFEGIKRLTSIDGKITKLIAEILPSRTNEYMSIVVTRHGGHPPLQLRIQLGTGGTIRLASTKEFAKWKPDSPQITSAVIATHESAEKGLIIGCRNGTIYSYSRLESSEKREFDSELPLSHGKEAVTAMSWLPDTTNRNMWNPSFGWLFSVGRDGTLAIHHFNGYYRDPVLVHRLTLSFGPNLEGIAIDPSTLDVSVWGFTSRYFMCQNVSAQQDTVTIECGGAHRIWNFAPFERSSDGQLGGLFAWIKAMKLNLAKVNGTSHKIIQYGGHGREIKSCVAASTSIRPNLGPLIATGAEDTNITISYFANWHAGQSQLKQIAVLRKHVTGVQSLHWSSDGHFLFSCGGFEEFYVWKLRQVPGVSIGIVCDSKFPLENADSELRITDFAVRDVVVRERSHLDDEQWVFLISMIYSDSSIKVWKYTSTDSVVPDREAWSFIANTSYTTACLTTASFLSTSTTGWPLVTGATDGHLTFWSLSDKKRKLTCESLQSLHQSSIKAMSAIELTGTSWLIATGGDDNALGFTMLTFNDEAGWYESSSLLVPGAHAAAVTGVSVIPFDSGASPQRERPLLILTASNDQVVRMWNVVVDQRRQGAKALSVKRGPTMRCAVADISSMALFATAQRSMEGNQLKVLVAGVGTEVFSVKTNL